MTRHRPRPRLRVRRSRLSRRFGRVTIGRRGITVRLLSWLSAHLPWSTR